MTILVDIGGIDDLHCSTFLFIMSCRRQKSNGHLINKYYSSNCGNKTSISILVCIVID
jgi:hypothetical protein